MFNNGYICCNINNRNIMFILYLKNMHFIFELNHAFIYLSVKDRSFETINCWIPAYCYGLLDRRHDTYWFWFCELIHYNWMKINSIGNSAIHYSTSFIHIHNIKRLMISDCWYSWSFGAQWRYSHKITCHKQKPMFSTTISFYIINKSQQINNSFNAVVWLVIRTK